MPPYAATSASGSLLIVTPPIERGSLFDADKGVPVGRLFTIERAADAETGGAPKRGKCLARETHDAQRIAPNTKIEKRVNLAIAPSTTSTKNKEGMKNVSDTAVRSVKHYNHE